MINYKHRHSKDEPILIEASGHGKTLAYDVATLVTAIYLGLQEADHAEAVEFHREIARLVDYDGKAFKGPFTCNTPIARFAKKTEKF